MNTAKSVADLIDIYRDSVENGFMPLSEACWYTSLACVGWAYVFGAWGAECTVSERKKRLSYNPSHTTIKTACKAFDGGSCSGCKWFPDNERTRCFDCRGFTDWILKQYGFDLAGEGATSQWDTAKNWCAKSDDMTSIPHDVLVNIFIRKDGKMSHTGFYYNGETCECSNGVQHFSPMKTNRWTHWAVAACFKAEMDTVNPGENAPSTPSEPADDKTDTQTMPTVRKGDKGDAVRYLQSLLMERGYDLGKWGDDGDFGNATEKAVKQFQRDWGLVEDGVVGKKTWAVLTSSPAKVTYYTVTIPNVTKTQADALVAQYPGAVAKEVK